MSITEVCVRRPVLAWMIMAATIVFGVVAAQRIGVSQMPDVDFPTVSVNVTWEGAAPEVIENDVVQVLEDSLAQVEGVTSLVSTARQGNAQITVELDDGVREPGEELPFPVAVLGVHRRLHRVEEPCVQAPPDGMVGRVGR